MDDLPVFRAAKRRKQSHIRLTHGSDHEEKHNEDQQPNRAFQRPKKLQQGLKIEKPVLSQHNVLDQPQLQPQHQPLFNGESQPNSAMTSRFVPSSTVVVSGQSETIDDIVPPPQPDQHGLDNNDRDQGSLVPEVDLTNLVADQYHGDLITKGTIEHRQKRARSVKPRRDRNGKPLPPRQPRVRKGPSEDDVARDKLVDEITSGNLDGDKKLARPEVRRDRGQELEQAFRARFEENAHDRRTSTGPKGVNAGGTGPRLGGGRTGKGRVIGAGQEKTGAEGRKSKTT